jgi:hypothetical protein
MLYVPRFLTLVWRTNRNLYWRLRHLYWRDIALPEDVAHFYHGSYVGDDGRIRKKIQGSAAAAWFVNVDEWFETVWNNPEPKQFRYLVDPKGWVDLEYVPTAELPAIIRDSPWPEGWIERSGQ